MSSCCSDCVRDCNWPWKKEKGVQELEVEVEHHFRGRVNSEASIGQMENGIPASIVTKQPQPEAVKLERPKHHKKDFSIIDSALLASSSGILGPMMKERLALKEETEGPQAHLCLICDAGCLELTLSVISISGYHSIFLSASPNTFSRSGTDTSPLNACPSLMTRISFAPLRTQIRFTSVHSKTKNPIWKERMAFNLDSVDISEQNLEVVLYESNKFSRWTAVKTGWYPLKDVVASGTHNLFVDLEPTDPDIEAYGEIKLAIGYNTSTKRISCEITQLRSLFHWSLNRKSEYYVKVQYSDKKKQLKARKTSACKADATSLVEINETISAKTPIALLKDLTIRLSICDSKQLMGDPCLYYLIFGEDNSSGPSESSYWSDFIRDVPVTGKKTWFAVRQK